MQYQVRPFHLLRLGNDGVYCFAPKTAIILNDTRLINVLEKIRDLNSSLCTREQLNFKEIDIFDRNEPLHRFLFADSGILIELQEASRPFKQLIIHTDAEDFRLFIKETFRSFFFADSTSPHKSSVLHLAYFEGYSNEKMKAAYRAASDSNSVIFGCYLLDNTLYLDPPFQTYSGMPCHWCHLGHLKGRKAEQATGQANSFFELFHYVLGGKVPLPLSQPLTPLKKNLVFWKLGRLVEDALGLSGLTRPVEFWGMQTRVDLQTGVSISDVALHWDLCECLTGVCYE